MLVLVIALVFLVSGGYCDAPPCDESRCELPDCFCSGTVPPGGLNPREIPQIVYVTLSQDAVTEQVYQLAQLLTQPFRNPNNCPYNLTLYTGGVYADFFKIEELFHVNRYEIAQRTENQVPQTSKEDWLKQIQSEKEILQLFAGLPYWEVKSYQAPRLQINEEMYEALDEDILSIDHSRPTCFYAQSGDAILFPYTYDYKSIQDCPFGTCPVNSYPGLWEVPMIDFVYPDSKRCGCNFIAGCTRLQNASSTELYNFLMTNFLKHYNYGRAPFGLYLSPAWFLEDRGGVRLEALHILLDMFQNMPDVWVVSVSQMIEWMKNPVPAERAMEFDPWRCPSRGVPRCSTPNVCSYTDFSPITMHTCSDCPPCYPTPADPTGQRIPCPPRA